MSNQSRLWGSQEDIGGVERGIECLLFLKNSVALDKACLLWYNINAIQIGVISFADWRKDLIKEERG
jgi:hypothetical protein